MTPPVKPEAQDQNNNSQDQSQSSTQNTPTEENVDTRFNAMRTAFFSTLAEKEAEINRLREEVSNTRRSSKEDRNPDESWREFTSDPETVVSRAIEKQIKPIRDEILSFRAQQVLDRELGAIAAQNAKFGKLIRLGRSYVEQVLGNAPINSQSVYVAVATTLGLVESGQLQIPGWQESTPANNRRETPPRIPSSSPDRSGPTPETHEDEKPWENMSENEKRLARAAGMSYEDYYKQQQENMLVVATTKKGGK